MTPTDDFLTIGRVVKTHGRRGEVVAEILTDFPDRFQAGSELLLLDGTAVETRQVEASNFHKARMIVKFAGCDSIAAAETLVGREVVIPKSSRRALPPGAVYLADLVGCAVREGSELLGAVEAVREMDETGESGAPVLLQVRTAQGELLIPFAAEICRQVDVESREIQVSLPEGLRELTVREETANKPRRGKAGVAGAE